MRRPSLLTRTAGSVLAVLVASLLFVAVATTAGAAPAPAPQLPKPKAQILVDAATGRILYGDNIHEAMHPASTAKILTALVAVERLAPDASVTVDGPAAGVETDKVGLAAGTVWPLDQMLAALMIISANDAAYAIAHTVGGDLAGFSTILNSTAKRLGLKDSTLNDPAGLDTARSLGGGPMMSAYDLAITARDALAVPAIAKWAALPTYDFTDAQGVHHHFVNHNKMLAGFGYAYPGATGFKTGFTNRGQHSLVATATRNGRTLIAVVLGAVTPGYAEAQALLNLGFASTPPSAGESLPDNTVSLYGTRAADGLAFSALGNKPDAPAGSSPATAPTATVVPQQIPALAQAPRAAPKTQTVVHHSSGGGMFSLRNVVIVLFLVGVAVFVLRRRSVRRRRAARLARKRQRAAAMRSGGLPVVDGKYRSGLRLGPPVESHVRVRNMNDKLDELELGTLDPYGDDWDELDAADA
jgi:D-alanyl-D-alanine carboxypeptidase